MLCVLLFLNYITSIIILCSGGYTHLKNKFYYFEVGGREGGQLAAPMFGKQEHKNISRPQPWKLFQNIAKPKKNTKNA